MNHRAVTPRQPNSDGDQALLTANNLGGGSELGRAERMKTSAT
jgi:hypothetical protein